MKLWRISNYADLSGLGSTKTPGRWHNKGIPVVYLSESPSLAMLEVLVHFELDIDEVPETFQLLEVEYADRKGIRRLSSNHPHDDGLKNLEYTRSIGDAWLTSMQSAILRAPSAIVPHSFNYLLNPRHDLAKQARIVSCTSHPYDNRLVL